MSCEPIFASPVLEGIYVAPVGRLGRGHPPLQVAAEVASVFGLEAKGGAVGWNVVSGDPAVYLSGGVTFRSVEALQPEDVGVVGLI